MRQSIVIDKPESQSKPVPFLRAKLAALLGAGKIDWRPLELFTASHTQASRLRVTTRVVLGLRPSRAWTAWSGGKTSADLDLRMI